LTMTIGVDWPPMRTRPSGAALRDIAMLATPDALLRWHRPVDCTQVDLPRQGGRTAFRSEAATPAH
jgi:hypothetical protein